MDGQSTETRLKALELGLKAREDYDGTLDNRVTAHGIEIDEMRAELTEIKVSDRHRDEVLNRIERAQNESAVKLDALRSDLVLATTGKSADRWDKAVWVVIAALIGYGLLLMGIR